MFSVLFIYPKVLARHQTGPGAAERERYLAALIHGMAAIRLAGVA